VPQQQRRHLHQLVLEVTMRLAACILVFAFAAVAHAQESRPLRPIERPQARAPLPAGAVRPATVRAVSRERVEAAVREIVAAWGDRRLDEVLSAGFYDRDRLRDVIEARVPRDARLRIVAIQGFQVVDQWLLGRTLVSRVSVTVRTQLEYNDPAAGLQRRDGVNDFLFTVGERVR
jgi:hypothetical protein